jgi:single-strand DNA-binding protein
MANLNKVMLIGRLTRDPESRTFSNGGKVTKFGFAVNNRKKNTQTGQWEDVPVFIDVSVFNRGEQGRQANLAEENLRKGHQLFIEGHLVFEQWDDKQSGQKRSKLSVTADNFQFLERRPEGGSGGPSSSIQRSSMGSSSMGSSNMSAPPPEEPVYEDSGMGAPGEGDIPF